MKPYLVVLLGIGAASLALTLFILTQGSTFPLLVPAGSIGLAERDLMFRAIFLMLIVVVPVYILTIFIAWHYRESNTTAAYTPHWEHSKMEELIWWSIPFEIVLVLSALTWSSTHELDPMRAITSSEPPITVEAVALPWRWLFIYPDLGIASMNEVALPVNRPVEFRITADAPMNSLWIPALGGQMYAMTGMTTLLHLMGTTAGDYPGRSANYSGEGFAQMQFTARVLSENEFDAWVVHARESNETLDMDTYMKLAEPSDRGPVQYYKNITMTSADILRMYMPMTAMGAMHHH